MSLSKMSAIGNMQAAWGHRDVGKHNFAELKNEIHIALLLMKDGFGLDGNMYDYIQSDEELQRNPRFINDDGSFKPRPGHAINRIRPTFVAHPDLSQANRTLEMDEYRLLLQDYLDHASRCEVNASLVTLIKNFFMDTTVWGRNIAKIAAGPLLSAVTDLPIDMWRRILLELDLLDDAATAILQTFYKTPWHGTIEEFQNEERRIHQILFASGRQYTDMQRMQATRSLLGHRAEVQSALTTFDQTNPTDAQRTLLALNAYLLVQAPNIKRNMPASAIYPQHQAAAALAEPAAALPWEGLGDAFSYMSVTDSTALQQQASDTMFTQAQMDEYAFKAIGAHMRTNPSKAGLETMLAIGERYCHVHGWGTHTGNRCNNCKTGSQATYWREDSRGFDKTRVIGHTNCNHRPRCISEQNAKAAKNPLSFPDTPGNAAVYTGKSG